MNTGIDLSYGEFRVTLLGRGEIPTYSQRIHSTLGFTQQLFPSARPSHQIVPFIAKRKAVNFSQDISLGPQSQLTGTLANLYARIDLLSTAGHPKHEKFVETVKNIVGLPITTTPSQSGKEAGFYLTQDKFITLERMGDGVSEMVGIIAELCLEKNKIFILEEPETNLHPAGLKSLLELIRTSSYENQFFIATHSNIVVRELEFEENSSIFRVFRSNSNYDSASEVAEIERNPGARMELMRELGYEFADFDLHDAWMFLEEASAETIIRDVLIPQYAPGLIGRLRTYSAGGATNLEPSFSEFQRLMVFIHLQPVYKNRVWVYADGDETGKIAVEKIRTTFDYLNSSNIGFFSEPDFELYYPRVFREKAQKALSLEGKQQRRTAKSELLGEVLAWTRDNEGVARESWLESAKEIIEVLHSIEVNLVSE